MKPAANRFDFLRLLFAGMVVAYHSVALPGLDSGGVWEGWLAALAELSIQGFFIISGALVYGSWLRSRSVADYAGKRIRRLYPAYAVIILVPAAIALILAASRGEGVTGLNHIGRYVAANLVFLNFLEPTLPGLFEGQRFPVVNGALWTLKIEVMFYLILPVLAWLLSRSGRLQWALCAFIYLGAELWRATLPALDLAYAEQLARQLPGQMSFFAAGMVLWLLRESVQKRVRLVGSLGAVVLVLSVLTGFEFFRAAGLAGVIALMAWAPGPRINAAHWGDVSYGVYITHFPIVNGLIAAGLFTASPGSGLVLTAFLTLGTSLVLWRLVERPFLRRDSHYRRGGRE